MPVLTNASFTLDVGKYTLNQSVPVYLQEKEEIGVATVTKVNSCSIIKLDGSEGKMEHVVFEFSDEIKETYSSFEPYYAGFSSKLCLFDIERHKRETEEREQERIRNLKRKLSYQSTDYKYICLKCESLIATSKKTKMTKCPICRKGTLIQ